MSVSRGPQHPGKRQVNAQKSVFSGALEGRLRSARPAKGSLDPAAGSPRRSSTVSGGEGGAIFRSTTPPTGLLRNDMWLDDHGTLWYQYWPEDAPAGAPGMWSRLYGAGSYPQHPAGSMGVRPPLPRPNYGVALGDQAEALGYTSFALFGRTESYQSLVMGPYSTTDGSSSSSVSIGPSNTTTVSDRSVVIGTVSTATNSYAAVVLGQSATAENSDYSFVAGNGASSLTSKYTVVNGLAAVADGSDYAIAIGNGARVEGSEGGLKVGMQGEVLNSSYGTSLGYTSSVRGSSWGVGLGSFSIVEDSSEGVAVGKGAQVNTSLRGVSVGADSLADNSDDAVVIGPDVTLTNSPMSTVLGSHGASNSGTLEDSVRAVILGPDGIGDSGGSYHETLPRESARVSARTLDVRRSPVAAAEVSSTDMSTTLVLRDPDNGRWEISVGTSGALTVTAL